jgi:hypothetical protein
MCVRGRPARSLVAKLVRSFSSQDVSLWNACPLACSARRSWLMRGIETQNRWAASVAVLTNVGCSKYLEHPAHESPPKSMAILVKTEQVAEALGLDDELLDTPISGFKL